MFKKLDQILFNFCLCNFFCKIDKKLCTDKYDQTVENQMPHKFYKDSHFGVPAAQPFTHAARVTLKVANFIQLRNPQDKEFF